MQSATEPKYRKNRFSCYFKYTLNGWELNTVEGGARSRAGESPRPLGIASQANLAWLLFFAGMGGWGFAFFLPLA